MESSIAFLKSSKNAIWYRNLQSHLNAIGVATSVSTLPGRKIVTAKISHIDMMKAYCETEPKEWKQSDSETMVWC